MRCFVEHDPHHLISAALYSAAPIDLAGLILEQVSPNTAPTALDLRKRAGTSTVPASSARCHGHRCGPSASVRPLNSHCNNGPVSKAGLFMAANNVVKVEANPRSIPCPRSVPSTKRLIRSRGSVFVAHIRVSRWQRGDHTKARRRNRRDAV